MRIIKCLLFFLLTMPIVKASNILCLFGATLPSHHIWNKSLIFALAARGHNLTVLTVEQDVSFQYKNIHFILMENIYEEIHKMQTFSHTDNVFKSIKTMYDTHIKIEIKLSQTSGVQTLRSYPRDFQFDLILHDYKQGHVLLGFVDYFGNPPLIALSASQMPSHETSMSGMLLNPSHVPHFMSSFSPQMSLMQRGINFLYHFWEYVYQNQVFLPTCTKIARRLFGKNVTSIEDIHKLTALLLGNVDYSIDYAASLPANVITIGGLHITREERLSSITKKFIDRSPEGTVLISLGAQMQNTQVSQNVVNNLTEAIRIIPHIGFIWKLPQDLFVNDPPSNLLLLEWLPQNSILAHPNVKLLITNGGQLSIQEAVWHAVPILGIPTQLEQLHNVQKIVRFGAGRFHNINNVTIEECVLNIHQIFTEESYSKAMSYRSLIFGNQQEHPLNRAVFWIENVIKYRGAAHLWAPSRNMNMFKLLMLDWFVILFLCLIGLFLFLRLYSTNRRHTAKIKTE